MAICRAARCLDRVEFRAQRLADEGEGYREVGDEDGTKGLAHAPNTRDNGSLFGILHTDSSFSIYFFSTGGEGDS